MSAVWITQEWKNEIDRLVKNIQITGPGYIKYHSAGISIVLLEPSAGGAGGTSVKWANITGVTDANNYTVAISADRNNPIPSETNKALYVYDIADALAVNDWIPVQASTRTGKDYENIQQLGLL